jgi:hypothetical protein
MRQRSGTGVQAVFDAGLDVVPGNLGVELEGGPERRADEEALPGHVVDVGLHRAEGVGALQVGVPGTEPPRATQASAWWIFMDCGAWPDSGEPSSRSPLGNKRCSRRPFRSGSTGANAHGPPIRAVQIPNYVCFQAPQ